MNEQTLNTPKSHEELADAINAAVNSGNHDELDRLMAVEIPEVTETEEVEEVEQQEQTQDEKPEETVTQDETSEDGSDEEKDETADGEAVSTPEDKAKDTKDEDEVAELRRQLHALKSDAGRVPYMQRRLQELERELRDTKLSRKVDEATTTKSTDTSKPRELPENLKKKIAALRDIDPDLADTLEEGFKASLPSGGSNADAAVVAKEMIQDVFRQQDEAKEQEFIQQQYSILVERVPQAPQIFKTPEWQSWKETLTPGRRALAESSFADEVQIAIAAFVQDMQAKFGKTNASETAPVTKQPTAQELAEAEKVRENRERKLNAQADVKAIASKGAKPKLSDEEQFALDYQQIRKNMGY